MSTKICPYPGLRPFTVEESYFFKGRDLNVRQIISKLETNKILILTGASGDGKSSLVYAGVIPNAKAGFFRAKYNRWVFADFRPERTPLHNLAQSISNGLGFGFDKTLEELNYGFSALIDLYKASPLYIDEQSDEWKNADMRERKQRSLQAANLFILADQFEEFFTNAENYNNGRASANAYTTVNLLLETARIALRDNLPVYVICTLRSDFISQCIAFRGLPEAIGFSQFFVPRLNRKELQQVIEEPALLSGGRVSKRLKETLINELHDGFDQLPILQHTLKRLWEMADNGNQEIDLLHLAKIGGLDPRFLSDDDQKNFQLWFKDIDEIQRDCIKNPSSSNVLNGHANFLYEKSFEYFNQNTPWAEKNITADDAKLIIKTAFQYLTKFDQGRAVRNRATIAEIVNIINKPNITPEIVCGVLNIYRLNDNTLLRPFIEPGKIETQYLSHETVLDITHEALIRNWEFLKKWMDEERSNILEFNEFKVQLTRWAENNKSIYFLLPIGPLLHFEEWYQECKPSRYWLAKYDDSNLSYTEKVQKACATEELSFEFVSGSRKYIEDAERTQKRRRKILFISSVVVILILIGFSYWALDEKANAQQQKIYAEQQTDSAKYQQKRAMEANKLAEEQRKIAEENARNALLAKNQSDSARALAETLRLIAEGEKQKAQDATNNAVKEKQFAEEQRALAEKQRKRAENASDSANMLSFLAISQSLGFKATQRYDDKQVNLLLAYQAYLYNEKYNGYHRDAVIYNGLYHALRVLQQPFGTHIPDGVISSFHITPQGNLILLKNGTIILPDNTRNNKYNTPVPVNFSSFLTHELAVIQLEDKKLALYDFKSGTITELPGHTDYVRTAVMNEQQNMFVTAGRDKQMKVWKYTNNKPEEIRSIQFDAKITCAVFGTTDNIIFAGTNTGVCLEINIETGNFKTIDSYKSQINAICTDKTGRIVILGFAEGFIRIIDTQTGKRLKEVSTSASGVRCLAIEKSLNLLAVGMDDKTIKFIDLMESDKNPVVIQDINQRPLALEFSGSYLYAITEENFIWKWNTEPDEMSQKVKSLITRNFTPDEWKHFVGENVSYNDKLLK